MTGSKSIRDYFDEMAAHYDQVSRTAGYAVPAWLARVLPEELKSRSFTCLDLGCGSGALGTRLREWNPRTRLWGIDLAPRMIEAARAKAIYQELYVHNLTADLKSLPLPQFDLVMAFGVFEFIEELSPLLSDIAGRMQPGAAFLFSLQEYDPADPHKPRATLNRFGFTHHARTRTEAEFLCAEAGLHLKQIDSVSGYVSPSSGHACPYLLIKAIKA